MFLTRTKVSLEEYRVFLDEDGEISQEDHRMHLRDIGADELDCELEDPEGVPPYQCPSCIRRFQEPVPASEDG